MWDEIIYPFPHLRDYTVEDWINNFIPHIIMSVITYPCWDWSWSMLVKGSLIVWILPVSMVVYGEFFGHFIQGAVTRIYDYFVIAQPNKNQRSDMMTPIFTQFEDVTSWCKRGFATLFDRVVTATLQWIISLMYWCKIIVYAISRSRAMIGLTVLN